MPSASTYAVIDGHTHLTDGAFGADRAEVLARARAAGVAKIAIVGQDFAENEAVLLLAATQPEFLPFLGLHPDRFADRHADFSASAAEAVTQAVVAQIRATAGRITGIGEVGLDHWVCQQEPRREAQRAAFTTLVRLALELDLPLNVHSRSAGRHTIELLRELGASRVLMHAFDGKAGTALVGVEAGFLFSIPPSIVRSRQKEKLVRALPLQALALETDSPVLGPEPGERNEPSNLVLSVEAIARIKGVTEVEVRRQTTENISRLFKLA